MAKFRVSNTLQDCPTVTAGIKTWFQRILNLVDSAGFNASRASDESGEYSDLTILGNDLQESAVTLQ